MPDKGVKGGIGVVGPLPYRCLRRLSRHRIVECAPQPVGNRAIMQNRGCIRPVFDCQGQQLLPLIRSFSVGKGESAQGSGQAAEVALQLLLELGGRETVANLGGQGCSQNVLKGR